MMDQAIHFWLMYVLKPINCSGNVCGLDGVVSGDATGQAVIQSLGTARSMTVNNSSAAFSFGTKSTAPASVMASLKSRSA